MRGVADNVFVSSGIVRQKKVNTYCSAQYFPSVDVNQNGVFAMQNRFKLPVFGTRLCLQFFCVLQPASIILFCVFYVSRTWALSSCYKSLSLVRLTFKNG